MVLFFLVFAMRHQPLLTAETIAHVKSVVAEHGADAWWEIETADLLPPVRIREI